MSLLEIPPLPPPHLGNKELAKINLHANEVESHSGDTLRSRCGNAVDTEYQFPNYLFMAEETNQNPPIDVTHILSQHPRASFHSLLRPPFHIPQMVTVATIVRFEL